MRQEGRAKGQVHVTQRKNLEASAAWGEQMGRKHSAGALCGHARVLGSHHSHQANSTEFTFQSLL